MRISYDIHDLQAFVAVVERQFSPGGDRPVPFPISTQPAYRQAGGQPRRQTVRAHRAPCAADQRRPDLPGECACGTRRAGRRRARGRGPRGASHRHGDLCLCPVRGVAFPARGYAAFQRALSAHPRANPRRERAGRIESRPGWGGDFGINFTGAENPEIVFEPIYVEATCWRCAAIIHSRSARH